MGLFDSLPSTPLKRAQIKQLERMDAVDGTFAVYSHEKPDTAYGLVILLNGTLRAWAYNHDANAWVEIDDTELEEPDGAFDDHDTVEAFHDKILDELDAVTV